MREERCILAHDCKALNPSWWGGAGSAKQLTMQQSGNREESPWLSWLSSGKIETHNKIFHIMGLIGG